MNIVAAAILILSASGSAYREMDVKGETIAGIIVQTGRGALGDALPKLHGTISGSRGKIDWPLLDVPTLRIDGEPRTGISGWGEGLWRVGGYVTDWQTAGDVQYQYRLRIRGYNVLRHTRIENGRVALTTTASWVEVIPVTKRITRRVPIHVQITIVATERDGFTSLVGTAAGTADTRDFRCGIIRSIAEQRAADALRTGLAAALLAIERQGTAWFHAGEFSPALDDIRRRVRAALKLRLRW